MTLPFLKISGAGNDFILIEDSPSLGPLRKIAVKLCDRRQGIGADGLLILKKGRPPRLDYYNSDGSPAFCGNGSRCAAWWMFRKKWIKKRSFEFKTNQGILKAEIISENRAAIRMPAPRNLKMDLKVKAKGRSWTAHFLNTGVPHAVIFVPDIDSVPVSELGRVLRFHKAFGPAGANVDFIQINESLIRMRTYERGVEDETLACGTGAVACATAGLLKRGLKSPVRIRARSGDRLQVSFRPSPKDLRRPIFGEVWLEGPVTPSFVGEVEL